MAILVLPIVVVFGVPIGEGAATALIIAQVAALLAFFALA